MRTTLAGGLFAIGCFAIIAACSSNATGTGADNTGKESIDGGGSTQDGSNTNTAPGKDAATNTDTDTDGGDTTTVSDEACAKKSANECGQCCMDNHAEGATIYDDTLVACECAASPAGCATECANSYCAQNPVQPNDGDACSKCLTALYDNESFCQELPTKCDANADCTALQKCGAACPQQ